MEVLYRYEANLTPTPPPDVGVVSAMVSRVGFMIGEGGVLQVDSRFLCVLLL